MGTRPGGLARNTWRRVSDVLQAWSEPVEVPARRRRWLTWTVWVIAIGMAIGSAGASTVVLDVAKAGGLIPFVGAAGGLPFALVLTRPMLGWFLSAVSAFAIAALLPIVDGDPWPWPVTHGIVLLALLFAVGAVGQPMPWTAGAWVATSALFAWACPPDIKAGWVVGVSTVAVIGFLIGRLASTNRRLAQQEERSDAEKAQRVVLEERARIARDLHDIVAHHMSLVVVAAETAQYRVGDLSETARTELISIGDVARSALTETRTLLSVLRRDEDAPEHAPQPDLGRLAELVDSVRRAGVDVAAELAVSTDDLRPGASLAVYRIAQEALANAARHAPGEPVRLRLQRHAGMMLLSVVNAVPPDIPDAGPGHGITGMRERARAEGGQLTAEPTPDGQFAVEAMIPIS